MYADYLKLKLHISWHCFPKTHKMHLKNKNTTCHYHSKKINNNYTFGNVMEIRKIFMEIQKVKNNSIILSSVQPLFKFSQLANFLDTYSQLLYLFICLRVHFFNFNLSFFFFFF